MSELRLPRLLSDGVVLQRRKSIHIWGWDVAGAIVTAKLSKIEFEAGGPEADSVEYSASGCENWDSVSGVVSAAGRFDVYLPARESGGPYELVVSDDKGNSIAVKGVMLVGNCS